MEEKQIKYVRTLHKEHKVDKNCIITIITFIIIIIPNNNNNNNNKHSCNHNESIERYDKKITHFYHHAIMPGLINSTSVASRPRAFSTMDFLQHSNLETKQKHLTKINFTFDVIHILPCGGRKKMACVCAL